MSNADDRFAPPERLVRTLGSGPADGAGRQWLASLPEQVHEFAERWELTPERVHRPGGRGSIVILARRADGTGAVLKLEAPDEATALEHAALTHWNGLGAVRVLQAEPGAGALLLERLRADVTLRSLAEAKAVLEATATLQRLWVRPADDHPFTSVADHTLLLAGTMREQREEPWAADARAVVDEALELRDALTADAGAGNGTEEPASLLHGRYQQGKVLAGERAPWLAVGPRPLVGERAYDLAWLARDRVDTLMASPGAAAIARRRVAKLADALDVDRDRLRGWTLFRTAEAGMRELASGARARGELLLEFAGML
ncbi:aminoglycoside phosphotransferase family protein [Streptomyces telluris]|uniref:Aminoglycoside phosphotransferase family protein n=1 Tax=Streptomyces telluris TaxID=2720021 RepID=A0A9X2LC84_9ACTN|nr:aminoglycoside phosphotransferase family protein [Streptomyces telluris]MCQ8768602.1 aminoglycoside phosphotransferase family protein [Streptomyces telluris]NJP81345.1 kinase [Streptomyces telluris]